MNPLETALAEAIAALEPMYREVLPASVRASVKKALRTFLAENA